MTIVWIGFHVEGLPALREVLSRGYDVRAVITLTEENASKRSGAIDYGGLCAEFGIPLHRVRNINDPEAVELLRSLAPDVCVVLGWSQIVREEALATARLGMVGAHASLLPRHRGRAPINWSLIKGDTETGNSLIWLAPGVDEGDIIEQTVIPITPYDTCATLYARVAESNTDMIFRFLDRIHAGERPGVPQAVTDEPRLPGRTPQDGDIDWTRSAQDVYNFIRALARPYPGAFSLLDGERMMIWRAALLPLSSPLGVPGAVLGAVVSPDAASCGQLVACGTGAVLLLETETEHAGICSGYSLSNLIWTGKVFAHGQS
ncbi:MAG: methionyl-tRNA formyltransferase [Ignavibacteria bacterium]|nr:methionyl-tRNA formyltransferase [Ignavibacteria bacterium]